MMRNLDAILEKAKWKKISNEELNEVVKRIERNNEENVHDLYTLIHILGRSGFKQHKKLIEFFLYYPDEPMISSIALTTLCDYWNLTDDYKDYLFKFLKGVQWDEEDQIKITSIGIAGEFARKTQDKQCLKHLLAIFKNDHNIILRSCAYSAILRAMGFEWNFIPPPSQMANHLEQYIDEAILSKAYLMVE